MHIPMHPPVPISMTKQTDTIHLHTTDNGAVEVHINDRLILATQPMEAGSVYEVAYNLQENGHNVHIHPDDDEQTDFEEACE